MTDTLVANNSNDNLQSLHAQMGHSTHILLAISQLTCFFEKGKKEFGHLKHFPASQKIMSPSKNGWMSIPIRKITPEIFPNIILRTYDKCHLYKLYLFPSISFCPYRRLEKQALPSLPQRKNSEAQQPSQDAMQPSQDTMQAFGFLSRAFFTPPRSWFYHPTNVLWKRLYKIYALF